MFDQYSAKDRRGYVWHNEVGVLRALARNANEPMYVGQIAAAAPTIWSSDMDPDKPKMFTRPGITAACRRLTKRGILIEEFRKTPRKKEMTPHYRIKPDLAVFEMILDEYEMTILDDIRSSLFGQSTIVGGAEEWLRKKVFSDRGLHGITDEDDLMMIKEFALFSTPALMVLLSEKIALDHYREMGGVNRTQLLVRHIRDVMHFAIAFDISKRSTAQLANEPLVITMELSTEITIGSKTWRTKSRFGSEKLAGKQRGLLIRNIGEKVGEDDG
jgi:hypothetical protein